MSMSPWPPCEDQIMLAASASHPNNSLSQQRIKLHTINCIPIKTKKKKSMHEYFEMIDLVINIHLAELWVYETVGNSPFCQKTITGDLEKKKKKNRES